MNPVIRRTVGIVDVKFGANVTVVEPANLYGCDIGDETFIGPFVEIQKGATIGKRCRIQSHSFICDLVTIGDDCFISHGAMFVNDLFVTGGPAGKPELWRSTKLGNHVSVGTNATILPVTICDLVTIGDDCFISHGAMFINDLFVTGGPAGKPELWRSTKLGNHVSVGTNATILPVTICDHVIIGAGAVVTKDVTVSGIYAGNPARLLRRLPVAP